MFSDEQLHTTTFETFENYRVRASLAAGTVLWPAVSSLIGDAIKFLFSSEHFLTRRLTSCLPPTTQKNL